jgi:hypothetical protein
MDPHPPLMPTWLRWLQQTGWGTTAAAFLDAVSPLAPVGAQVLYLIQPITGGNFSLARTAEILEDPAALARTIEALEQGVPNR